MPATIPCKSPSTSPPPVTDRQAPGDVPRHHHADAGQAGRRLPPRSRRPQRRPGGLDREQVHAGLQDPERRRRRTGRRDGGAGQGRGAVAGRHRPRPSHPRRPAPAWTARATRCRRASTGCTGSSRPATGRRSPAPTTKPLTVVAADPGASFVLSDIPREMEAGKDTTVKARRAEPQRRDLGQERAARRLSLVLSGRAGGAVGRRHPVAVHQRRAAGPGRRRHRRQGPRARPAGPLQPGLGRAATPTAPGPRSARPPRATTCCKRSSPSPAGAAPSRWT